jgi:hypothetical protein
MNLALSSNGSLLRFIFSCAFQCVWIAGALAAEQKLYVFWDTVSPDGRYAMAWSTTGEATIDQLPSPYENDKNPVANYVIEVATRKIVVLLPDYHYWHLYGGSYPNHYSLDTVWSGDSRLMLATYDSRWSTDAVFLVDVSVPQAVNIEDQLKASITRTFKSTRGNEYTKYEENLVTTIGAPWFVAAGQFYVAVNASIPKKENPDFNLGLYFQIENGGTSVNLIKSEPGSFEESPDRSLNRNYRKLRALLSADEQKSLVEEERAWLARRDAIKSERDKKAFVEARAQALQTLLVKAVEAREQQ